MIDETFSRQQGRAAFGADLHHDATFAIRLLRRQRLPSIVAVLCLALGIGATTTMFSIGNTLLLRPLPYPNAGRVVAVNTIHTDEPREVDGVVVPRLLRLADAVSLVRGDGRAASGELHLFALHSDADPGQQRDRGASPDCSAFVLRPDDSSRLTTIARALRKSSSSHIRLRRRELGGAANIVGKTFIVGGVQRTVIGVIPDRWAYPTDVATLGTARARLLPGGPRKSRARGVCRTQARNDDRGSAARHGRRHDVARAAAIQKRMRSSRRASCRFANASSARRAAALPRSAWRRCSCCWWRARMSPRYRSHARRCVPERSPFAPRSAQRVLDCSANFSRRTSSSPSPAARLASS